MTTDLIIIVLVLIAGFTALYFLLQRMLGAKTNDKQLENMVHQVFGMSAQSIAQQSKQILSSEKETIRVDLDNKQRVMENLVKQLQDDIKIRQDEIRVLEQDRTQKFGQLTNALDQHRLQTEQLRLTAEQLATVLSNNQTRGGWGERIIEDLMIANGLVEGIHYLKQQTQIEGNLRPDVTLLLPNKRFVPVDVKFPYAALQKMALTKDEGAKAAYLKQFTSDVKNQIDKVSQYIDPANNTLDYAILFVPNEMVFSYINQKLPDLVDSALAKRVLLVSPFTFLIVARTIMESYRNFMLSDKLRDVVKSVDEFVSEWDKFKEKFGKYGRSLDTLKFDYDDLMGTRVRQMEKRIDKISLLQTGTELLDDKKEVAELPIT